MTPHSHAPQFDTGPLSWVMGEIREALARSAQALQDAAARSDEGRDGALKHAKTYLHQAHGALQMVDVDGVGLMTQGAEDAIDRFKDGVVECTPEHIRVVLDGYTALTEYLDELLSGAPQQPARLFPYYRALQELLKAERIHPADLLFVDLGAAGPLRRPGENAAAPDYAACRSRFEKALLPFLKSADAAAQQANAKLLEEAISEVTAAQLDVAAHTFWLAMQAFAELVAQGQLASNLYVKQLFGLINLQLRRLSQGQAQVQGLQPEAMLRDALFFIAAAAQPSPNAQALRRAFRLDGVVPHDYDYKRYGRINADALKDARDALSAAQAAWDRLASEIDPQLETEFQQQMDALGTACAKLGSPALAQLMSELARAARDSVMSGRSPQFALEMATALLFAQQGLERIRQLPEDFDAHAEVIGARLLALAAGETPSDAAQWQDDLSRQIQHEQTVAVLASEMKNALRQVEKVLDDFYADGSKRPSLSQIGPLLHQLEGAVAILDQDDAMRSALHVKDAVRELASAGGDPDKEAQSLQNIAQNIGALGFFVDMLAQNSEGARKRFSFDRSEGMLRAVPFDAAAAEQPVDDAAPVEPVADLPPAVPLLEDDGIEAELLEIFIGEAQEVLALIRATLPQVVADPANQETLTVLRRSFHTLKGSGRMVGLNNFAEGAAAVEKTMNVWLSELRAATPDLLALLEGAAADMDAWVAELVATGTSRRDSAALVEAAVRVMEGGAFAVEAVEAAEVVEPVEPVVEAPQVAAPVLEQAPAGARVIDFPSIVRLMPPDDNLKRIGTLEIPLPLYNIYMAETDELLRTLARDFGEWRHEHERGVSADALKAAHTLAGTSATVGFKALRAVAYALEMALAAATSGLADAQHELLDDTVARVRQMLQSFALGELAPEQPELVTRLEVLRTELEAQDAASYGGALVAADPELEGRLHALFAATLASIIESPPEVAVAEPVAAAPVQAADDDIDALFDDPFDDPFDAPELTQAAPPLVSDEDPDAELLDEEADVQAAEAPTPVAPPMVTPEAETHVAEVSMGDELDADLLPVFIEEASDLLPEIGIGLRAWQANPADAAQAQLLQRALHTVKGSARMAGAMRLGQHAHDIETQIENMVHAGTRTPAAFDELIANYDQALAMFEQLQHPGAHEHTMAPAALSAAPAPAEEAPSQQRTALVRVRADILDRLVNQAGEVSITRSKLESQVATLKASLADFSENLARLRRQLREVEMQAETQIASRMSIAGEREFDPLEFDRFTRLQELTRMMAESVNDVGSFHESLGRTVDSAGADLATQSRLTRDLQRDLMRVRMVPFASLSERLFRVARQTAKEVDKRVNLDIRGGSVEIDRSVLEQMAGPFEHLLRNAIVHGVESRSVRGVSGKAETGELLIQASQQGNEVVIEFTDDGAGLDLDRIRAKARENGLLADGQQVSDAEASELIFQPGFSTAEALTELAGRGVGMDVVRSQAHALGGRIEIATKPGQGACFTIHLPLTLAVTQVVLTTSGGHTYAMPSILVEQVLQMKDADVQAAHAAGCVQFQGQRVALHFLPTLLGDAGARPMTQRSCPVLILRSGNDRLAVQVDDVQGNREVVVKNVGPQLARMVGIAGATVLGSGDIVLILNPVALAQHLDSHPELRPQGEVSSPTTYAVPQVPSRDYVVMVVDDSLTVRKVTQRLLEREGYQVMLAKDGVDALERLQETLPDLMLVDIEMPRMDGFDLTRNIRGNDSTRAIPIIMITSRTADKHRNYALDLGVNAYFGKPFQEDVLLAAVSGLLKREMPVGV